MKRHTKTAHGKPPGAVLKAQNFCSYRLVHDLERKQMYNQEKKLKNTIDSLRIVGRFGWARTDCVGPLVWPSAKEASSIRMAQRLMRRLVKEKLLIERTLPLQAGSAYILSGSGLRLARQHGTRFQTNKDWGNIENRVWAPPGDWIHDLWLQLSIVWILRNAPFGKVVRFWTERELHSTTAQKKIPDALFQTQSGEIYWVEVERSKKSGAPQDLMIETVLQILGKKVTICGVVPGSILFVVPTNLVDSKGHKINHRQNIENAFTRKTTSDILPLFLEFEQKGAAPTNFSIGEQRVIESDSVSRRLARLETQMRDFGPHQDEDGTTVWDMPLVDRFVHANPGEDKYIGTTIWKLADGRCFLTVKATTIFPPSTKKERDEQILLEKEEAPSLAAAKRKVAGILVRWQEQ